jgi:hypothetical protein
MHAHSIPSVVLLFLVSFAVSTPAAISVPYEEIPHADGIGVTIVSTWADGTSVAGTVRAEDLERGLPWDPESKQSGLSVPVNLALHVARQYLKSAFPSNEWSLSALELRERADYWFYILQFRRDNSDDILCVPIPLTGKVGPMEIKPGR